MYWVIVNGLRKKLEIMTEYKKVIEQSYDFSDYKENLKDVTELCDSLQNITWTDQQIYPYCIQAEALLILGTIYEEKHLYDQAIPYFENCIDLIERRLLEQFISKIYILALTFLAKCFKEKHCQITKIEKPLEKAKKFLEDVVSENDPSKMVSEFHGYKYVLDELNQDFGKISFFLYHQYVDCKIDTFGQGSTIEKEIEKILDSLGKMNKLDNSEQTFAGIPFKHNEDTRYIYPTMLGLCINELFLKKEIVCVIKGKNADTDDDQLNVLKNYVESYLEKNDDSKSFSHFPNLPNIPSFGTAMSIWFYILKKDKRNTISLGNIALYLFYLSGCCRMQIDTSSNHGATSDFNKYCQNFFEKLIDLKLLDSKEFNFSSVKSCDLNNLYEFFDAKESEVINKILEIEATNIFALNLNAILWERKMFCEKSVDYDNITEYYPVLRQAALKKRFFLISKKLDECLSSKISKNSLAFSDTEKNNFLELKKRLLTYLTVFSREIIRFMNFAAINLEDSEWSDLIVCHYTRMAVLPKLINKSGNSKIRLYNVHHLNDPMEGITFMDALKVQIKVLPQTSGNSQTSSVSLLQEILNNYTPERNGGIRNSVYMGSYSEQLDQLNMWTQYGEKGHGCNLRIDAKKTFDSGFKTSLGENTIIGYSSADETTHSYQLEDDKYPLYMVLYLPDDFDMKNLEILQKYTAGRAKLEKDCKDCRKGGEARWWKKQSELLDEFPNFLEHISMLLKEIDNTYTQIVSLSLSEPSHLALKNEITNTVMVMLDLVRFLCKSDSYKDEREFRVLQYSSHPQYDETDSKVPLLYIEMNKKIAYQGICFGPLVPDCDSQAAYVLNIKKEDTEGHPFMEEANYDLKIVKSKIHYR